MTGFFPIFLEFCFPTVSVLLIYREVSKEKCMHDVNLQSLCDPAEPLTGLALLPWCSWAPWVGGSPSTVFRNPSCSFLHPPVPGFTSSPVLEETGGRPSPCLFVDRGPHYCEELSRTIVFSSRAWTASIHNGSQWKHGSLIDIPSWCVLSRGHL